MITYIINFNTKIAHKAIDGRTLEQCNVDQIKRKIVIDPTSVQLGNTYRMCKRCG